MPRRALILLTLLVLALHWLVLGGVPLGGTDQGSAQRLAFHTRMVTPAPPTPAAETAKAQPAAPEKPRTQPAPKPKPRPRPHPEPTPAAAQPPAEAELPGDQDAAADASLAPAPPAEAFTDIIGPASDAASGAASVPEDGAQQASPAADTASSSDSNTNAASAPPAEHPDDELSAGVDIRPPGAAGGQESAEPPPIRLPATATLKYAVTGEVKKMRYNVNGELSWRNDGDRYEARQEISAFLLGTRSQTSTGKITPRGLEPARFGDKGKREVAAHFDFDQHIVIFSANTNRTPIGPGAQDRVSVLIQLAAMLAAAPDRYPSGTQIAFTTIGPRNADRWIFTVGETQILDLPAGPTRAIRLQKQPRHERDLQADLWLGIEQQYLPVQLRLTQSNGDYAELKLK
ncbi:DUF3108 domain-containing protein [Diaphorobacter ruginosibacter]|uniref:DUF3108 domain-containing protein n=1 Tax=Diaphorobacter ruginosibacter TaxID=1715720 RepID=UPI0033402B9C